MSEPTPDAPSAPAVGAGDSPPDDRVLLASDHRAWLGRLRWFAVLLPMLFLATTAAASQFLLRPALPPFESTAVEVVGCLVAVTVFAGLMFGRIERAEEDLLRQSRERLRLAADNQALLEQTRRRADESAALYGLGREIAASTSTAQVLETVYRQAIDLLGADDARICLLDANKRTLRPGLGAGHRSLPCAEGAADVQADRACVVLEADGAVDLSRRRGFCPLMEQRLTRTHLAAPVRAEGELLGAMCVGSAKPRKWDASAATLLENLATLTAIAVNKETLQRRLAALAIVEERDRIAMDLHDGIIQTIYGVGLSLEKAVDQVPTDPVSASSRVERAIGDLNGVIQDVRTYIFELERSEVDASDVRLGLARLAQEVRESTEISVDLEIAGDVHQALPGSAAPHVLKVAREALANVVRHSGSAKAAILLRQTAGRDVELVVRDEGRGIDAGRVAARPRKAGLGLVNMAERARLLGGQLRVQPAAGGGTEVRMVVPAAPSSVVSGERAAS